MTFVTVGTAATFMHSKTLLPIASPTLKSTIVTVTTTMPFMFPSTIFSTAHGMLKVAVMKAAMATTSKVARTADTHAEGSSGSVGDGNDHHAG